MSLTEQMAVMKRKQMGHMNGWFIRANNRVACQTQEGVMLEFESRTKGHHGLLSNG